MGSVSNSSHAEYNGLPEGDGLGPPGTVTHGGGVGWPMSGLDTLCAHKAQDTSLMVIDRVPLDLPLLEG